MSKVIENILLVIAILGIVFVIYITNTKMVSDDDPPSFQEVYCEKLKTWMENTSSSENLEKLIKLSKENCPREGLEE